MKANLPGKTKDEIVAAIDALDLSPIKFKLMDREEGYGWSRQYADAMEIEYKRFLTLLAKYPDETIVPNKAVDKFWHGHILDTLKYAEDCRRVFGYFLHHFPYFGMRGEDDARNLSTAGQTTRGLYKQEFGEPGTTEPGYCGVAAEAKDAYCGVAAAGKDAYCGAAAEGKDAYCGVAAEGKDAYCGVAAADKDAYCGVAAEGKDAYCGVAAAGKDAYCGVAAGQPQTLSANKVKASAALNIAIRPSL